MYGEPPAPPASGTPNLSATPGESKSISEGNAALSSLLDPAARGEARENLPCQGAVPRVALIFPCGSTFRLPSRSGPVALAPPGPSAGAPRASVASDKTGTSHACARAGTSDCESTIQSREQLQRGLGRLKGCSREEVKGVFVQAVDGQERRRPRRSTPDAENAPSSHQPRRARKGGPLHATASGRESPVFGQSIRGRHGGNVHWHVVGTWEGAVKGKT